MRLFLTDDLNITNTNGYFKHKNLFGAKIFATKSKERNIINKNVLSAFIAKGARILTQWKRYHSKSG